MKKSKNLEVLTLLKKDLENVIRIKTTILKNPKINFVIKNSINEDLLEISVDKTVNLLTEKEELIRWKINVYENLLNEN